MKKCFFKLLSLILVLSLLMGIVPRQVYAEAGASFPPEEPGDLSQEYIDNSRPVSVEGEVTNLRSEDGKHFKLTDGTFLSVSYYEPIHYLDSEGNWQDIDNSLYLDKDGKSYSTKENGGHSFSLAKDLSSGELVTTFQGDFSVSMKLLGGYDETSAMEIRERGKEKPADETKSWTADDLMPRNLSSKVIYKDVFKDVDIEYTLHGFDLKEQIVLNEKGDQTSFDFLLSFEGLSATLSENGSVLLQDSEGTPIYTIPVPFMEDAMGRTSYDVWYELTETEDGIIFTVTAGSEWLSAEDRVYPVRIDPTLYARTTNNDNTSSANTYTTYTLSYYPGTGIGTWAGLPQHLFIGYDPSSGATRGYVHFHNLPSVPSGSEVIGAYYGIYLFSPYWDGYYGYYGVNSSQIPLELREVTSQKPSWYNSYYDWFINLSWNDQYSMSYGPIVDYEAADWGSAGGWLRWDVSGLAKKWYTEGTENRTVMICSSEESSYYDYYYAWIRSLGYGDTYPPTLAVAYRNTAGIEPYYTYNSLDGGHAGTAYISDRTGQLKAAKELVSYHSTVNPVSISLVYNSDYFKDSTNPYLPYGPSMDFGSGWTLDIVQKLEQVSIDNASYLKYTDGDGTQHFFAEDSQREAGYYYDEDGLGLKIRPLSGSYEMSDDKGNKRVFTDGYLRQIIDQNGNEVSINYTNGKLTSVVQENNNASSITVASLTYTGDGLASVTDAAGIITYLTYTDGKLTGITRGNTLLAEYGYQGQRLIKLTDAERECSLNFTYDTNGRVSSFYDSAIDDSQNVPVEVTGARFSVSYPKSSQTVYKDFGSDRTENTSDDIYTSYLFDYFGRTVNAYSTDADGDLLGATNAVYTYNDGTNRKNNRSLRISSMGESGDELLSNADIEGSGGWGLPSGSSITTEESHSSSHSIKINGSWDSSLRDAYQIVSLNGAPGTDTYVLSGWAKGVSVPNTNYSNEADHDHDTYKQFGLRAVIVYTDNTSENHYVSFCPDLTQWQFVSMAVVPRQSEKYVSSIRVYIVYEQNCNAAYFDDISLIKESCRTMKYDADGNLVSVHTTGLEEVSSTYSGGNLIGMVTGGYGSYTLSYDTNHNLTSVTDGNVTQSMAYSGQGNVTNTILSGGALQIESSASYDVNGNRVVSETDDAGNTVYYTYSQGVSEMLGLPASVTNGRNITQTSQYDPLGRTTLTSLGNTVSAEFEYADGNLTSLTRTAGGREQEYSFGYDAFGKMTSIDVGDYTLAEYAYASGNGNLTRENFGNGDYVTYTYDSRDRVSSWTDSDLNARAYTYDENSRISDISDTDGRSYHFTYDSLDRITGHNIFRNNLQILAFSKSYNENGQTAQKSWALDNTTYTRSYTYGSDTLTTVPKGMLYSMTSGLSDDIPLVFDYDALARLSSVTGKTTKEYTYASAGQDHTTTFVSGYTNSYGNSVLLDTAFTYDGNGNIASETIGNTTWNYTYDNQDQLISATDGSTTYTYTYDGAGNILTSSDGVHPHTYTYGDNSWKDLLTGFDGHTISYDGSGNPLSYYNGRDWSFSWGAGNVLSSAESTVGNVETDISYGYDLDGIRTEKTVTKTVYHSYVDTVVAPTCTQQGYTEYACSSCNNTYTDSYVSALGHSYVDTVIAPTCIDDGYTQHTCNRCGDTYSDSVVLALGHNYVDTIVDPTCIDQGYTQHCCSRCNASYSDNYISALGHNYVDTVIAPTCTEQGYTQHTCSRCSDSYSDNYTPALGHFWAYGTNGNAVCLRCGYMAGGDPVLSPPGPIDTEGTGEEPNGLFANGESDPLNDPDKPVTEIPVQDDIDQMVFDDEDEPVLGPEIETPESVEVGPLRSGGQLVESEITVTYSYIYAGDKLLQEKVTTGQVTETHNFFYDNNGIPYAMQIGNDVYYYITNLQGDVVGMIDTSGIVVANYTYDPYGKVLSATGILAETNPLRYRGYYYDTESGLYYLFSRYYDPNNCRFISVDSVSYIGADGSLLTFNLFAYCGNNPVMGYDPEGTFNLKGIIAGALITIASIVAFCATGVSLNIAGAGVSTGAVMIVAAAKDSAMVVDWSVSGTIPIGIYGKAGSSFIIDFNEDDGGVYGYPHYGGGSGYSSGISYSVGFVVNY